MCVPWSTRGLEHLRLVQDDKGVWFSRICGGKPLFWAWGMGYGAEAIPYHSCSFERINQL
jgi:hypothetical protein